jgi:hypothetical protein
MPLWYGVVDRIKISINKRNYVSVSLKGQQPQLRGVPERDHEQTKIRKKNKNCMRLSLTRLRHRKQTKDDLDNGGVQKTREKKGRCSTRCAIGTRRKKEEANESIVESEVNLSP